MERALARLRLDPRVLRPARSETQHDEARGAAGGAEHPAPRLQRCACGGSCPRCRGGALPVNTPGDRWEREADRMADAALSPGGAGGAPSAAPPALRRCACGGSCPSCVREKEEKEEKVQREAAGSGGAGFAPPVVHEVLASPGRPLPPPARASMEARFGADFSHVRVHDDTQAAESARAVDAHAYTVGSDVVFGAGEYAPGSPAGDRLLAHELAHVVQQDGDGGGGAPPPMVSRYRKQGTPNFRACDDGGLVEKEYAASNPWIEQIRVKFTGITHFADGDLMPIGELSATYASTAARPAITGLPVSGGYASEGLTDRGDFRVLRIEGCGYHDTTVPKADRSPQSSKYFAPGKEADASMSFAIFFRQGKSSGNQAIHQGLLSAGSLACVHVGDVDKLRQLNYHSRVTHTKVTVTYDSAVLTEACCARRAFTGRMVANPCGKVNASSCPKKQP